MKFIPIYLLIINAAGFLVMTIDKLYAVKKMQRIPERTLLGIAVFGGSVGVWVSMYAVRHKTRHPKFVIGVPVILLLQILMSVWLLLH